MLLFVSGILTTLTVLVLAARVYPFLTSLLILTLWDIRRSNVFVWSIFDAYFRQKSWCTGPRMGRLTRQQRRRIERHRVRLGLL